MQNTKNTLLEKINLDHIGLLSLPVWPFLWGFFAMSEINLSNLFFGVIFVVCLRLMFYSTLKAFPTNTEEKTNVKHIVAIVVSFITCCLLSYFMGGMAMFLFILWLVSFGLYLTFYRNTWWPHLSYGVLFGAFPALFGAAATLSMSLSAIWPMLAAFCWVTSIEMVRSGTALDEDQNEHLTIASQVVGDFKISYCSMFFAGALALLFIAGLFNKAHGIYYAGLMIAEALMLFALRDSDDEKACIRFYTYSTFASIIVCASFLAL